MAESGISMVEAEKIRKIVFLCKNSRKKTEQIGIIKQEKLCYDKRQKTYIKTKGSVEK